MSKLKIEVPQSVLEGLQYFPTGSRYICDPPVVDTDIDYCVLLRDANDRLKIESMGFEKSSGDLDEYQLSCFTSYRRGHVNLIVTENFPFAYRFYVATELAKRFNLINKVDRVALFNAILYPAEELFEDTFISDIKWEKTDENW